MKAFLGILLLSFTAFAFAQDVMEGSLHERGMAPPVEVPDVEDGEQYGPSKINPLLKEDESELGQDPGAMGGEGEEQPE